MEMPLNFVGGPNILLYIHVFHQLGSLMKQPKSMDANVHLPVLGSIYYTVWKIDPGEGFFKVGWVWSASHDVGT